MVDDVARALCDAAWRSAYDACGHDMLPACAGCDRSSDGRAVCTMWQGFRKEAQAAISAAYKWNKKERRWPSFVK